MRVLRRSWAKRALEGLATLAIPALLGISCAASAPPGNLDWAAGDPTVPTPATTLAPTPAQAQSRGDAALARGDFEAALAAYLLAGRLAPREGNREASYAALLGRARALSALGEYAAAQDALEEAAHLAEAMGDGSRTASAQVALGGIQLAQGRAAEAEAALRAGADAARKLGQPALEAAALNDLGNAQLLAADSAAAADLYLRAAPLAVEAGDFGLAARSWANAARAQRGQPQRVLASVDRAEEALARVSDANTRSALLLNLGLGLREAAQESPGSAQAMRTRSTALLEAALAAAGVAGNVRIQSQALGGLGGLAEEAGRVPEALDLTRRALESGRGLDAPESIYL